MYNKMLDYVKQLLEKNNALHTRFCFRNRFNHIYRVYRWAMVLADDNPGCNRDLLLISAIFHDAGYAYGKLDHAKSSADVFMEYAKNTDLDSSLIENIYKNISLHSNKELMEKEDTQLELLLLMEADLLDEEGALGIVWDLLGEGGRMPSSYKEGLDCIFEHSAHIFNQDFMVTKKAREIWEKKKKFVHDFVEELKNDLFID